MHSVDGGRLPGEPRPKGRVKHPDFYALQAAPAAFAQALNDAVATFVVDRNVDNFANALVKATKEHQSTK